MSKFKVGDKVRVVKNTGDSRYDRHVGYEFVVLEVENLYSTAKYVLNCPSPSGILESAWEECELELMEDVKMISGMTKEMFFYKYLKNNVAVHCKTKELAREFLDLADGFGIVTNIGECIGMLKNYSQHEENTCYSTYGMNGNLGYGKLKFMVDNGVEIIAFESLKQPTQLPQPQKSLLKSGDEIFLENGDRRFVLVETNSIHDYFGTRAGELDKYSENLKVAFSGKFKVMLVYRNGELVMERTEKSEKELRKEEIEAEMAKLQKELDELK